MRLSREVYLIFHFPGLSTFICWDAFFTGHQMAGLHVCRNGREIKIIEVMACCVGCGTSVLQQLQV